MKDSGLLHTKKKLTVIFTLLVFAIAVLLEGVFFSVKYYNYVSQEEKKFNVVTSGVENKYVTLDEFVNKYDVGKRLFKMGQGLRGVEPKKIDEQVSLLIIDRIKRELVFSNVVDDLSVEFVNDILKDSKYGETKQDDGYLFRKINVIEKNNNYDVLFIKNLRYNFSDYLTDLFGFVFITLLFSLLFYYIGYKFVSKNLEPVEENLRDMQDFVHNAGHELKTPISIIHSNLQLIKETKTFEKDLILEGLTEINRLDHLIESLIELSNINSSKSIEKTDIKSEIKTIIKDFKVESEKKEIKIKFKVESDKVLTINKQYFYILFSNLLANAIKYTENGGKINITLDKHFLKIEDTGIGIKSENLEKIFERFFMTEQSRNNDGHGIGLSLVKKISDIYNWKLKVKSDEGKGSEFVIEF